MEFDCRVLQWCPGRVGCQRKAQQHRGPSRSLQARHLCWYSAFKHLPCLTNLTICALFCKYKTTSLLQCLPEEGHKVWSFSFTSWWSSLLSPCKLVSFRCVIDLCLTWALFCCYREQSLPSDSCGISPGHTKPHKSLPFLSCSWLSLSRRNK